MKGLELCEKYYEEYGKPMLERDFPEIKDALAAGLVGSGSECFGYDDEISTDHDFEPGFCIFVPDSFDDRKTLFRLERAYAKLPSEFMGYKRSVMNPAGGSRRGVMYTGDFYASKTGARGGFSSEKDFFSVPESYLAEAVNGKVFSDPSGEFSRIRASLSDIPMNVRLKKLAGHLASCAQSGAYNYSRCLSHGETGAAQLAAIGFADHAMGCAFALSGKYRPYYKWSFRALRELPVLSGTADVLEFLISSDNSAKTSETKTELIYDVSDMIIKELKSARLSDAVCGDLEKHAFSVNDRITDPEIRNMSIFSGI